MFPRISTDKIRNFCLTGNVSCGKTSVAEAIVYNMKISNRFGSIEEGNTFCDYNDDEIERKMSISSKVVSFIYKEKKINMIDTPGYPDFIGDVVSSIRVCDTGVIVVSVDNINDPFIEDIVGFYNELKKPFVFFINKLDKENIEFNRIIEELQNIAGKNLMSLTIPLKTGKDFNEVFNLFNINTIKIEDNSGNINKYREKLIDTIAGCDDSLTEKYLEGQAITEKELVEGLRNSFRQGKIIPVLCGSATKNIGIDFLVDFIAEYGSEPEVIGREKDDFVGLVFKTNSEPGMGQMNFVRIFSGSLSQGKDIFNKSRNLWERVGQICFIQGKKRIDANSAIPGDIIVLVKLKDTRTNDVLTETEKTQLKDFELIKFPETAVDMALYTKSKEEQEKVSNALASAVLEDPTLKYLYNTETKEMIISGLGNIQIEIMIKRIKDRFGVDVELKKPRIPYKETVKKSSHVQGKYKRQSGGRGQYGDCWLKIEPLERGKGFEFIDKIFGGVIPKNYIPSIEKGVLQAMSEGVIAGYPVVDIRVTVDDGSYHEVDSSDIAFKIAAAMALRKGVLEANPCILEPIMNLEVVVPESYLGAIMGDISGRRGRILGTEQIKNKHVVKAQVPMSELYQYSADLRSLTKGAGKFKMTFSNYEELPAHLAQPLIDEFQKSKKVEE